MWGPVRWLCKKKVCFLFTLSLDKEKNGYVARDQLLYMSYSEVLDRLAPVSQSRHGLVGAQRLKGLALV